MVRSRTATLLGRGQAALMEPSEDPETVAAERALTVECVELLRSGGRLPFHDLKDPHPIVARLGVDGVRLAAQEIYDLCLVLQNAREIRDRLEKASLDDGFQGADPGRICLERTHLTRIPGLTDQRDCAGFLPASEAGRWFPGPLPNSPPSGARIACPKGRYSAKSRHAAVPLGPELPTRGGLLPPNRQ